MEHHVPYIKQDVEWGFWLRWTLVSILGWFGGAFVGQLISQVAGMLIGLALTGAIVGLVQWFILQGWVKQAGWWVPATAVGVALAGVVGGVKVWVEILRPESDQVPYVALTVSSLENMIVGGVIPGIVQWLALRQWVYRAGWWIAGSAVAWAAGIGIIGFLTVDLAENILQEGLDGYESIVVGMSVTSALTGLLIRWQLGRVLPQAQIVTADRWGSLWARTRRS
jgi:hypothetical protein